MRELVSRSACAFLIIRRTHIAPCHRARRLPLEAEAIVRRSSRFMLKRRESVVTVAVEDSFGRGCLLHIRRGTAERVWCRCRTTYASVYICSEVIRCVRISASSDGYHNPCTGQPYYRQRCVISGNCAWSCTMVGATVALVKSCV